MGIEDQAIASRWWPGLLLATAVLTLALGWGPAAWAQTSPTAVDGTQPETTAIAVPVPVPADTVVSPASADGPRLSDSTSTDDAPAYLVWGLVLSAVLTVALGVILVRGRRA